MQISEYEVWFKARYRRTSSALNTTFLIISDLLGVLFSFGVGFFLVNLYDMEAINFKSFVTYWSYLPAFILVFWTLRLYPGVSMAPAEELRNFFIGSIISHGGIIISRYIEDREFGAISAAFIISFIMSVVFLQIFRAFAHFLMTKAKLKGIPAVIYGSGHTAKTVVDRLLTNKRMSYSPVLILDDNETSGDYYQGIPIIHDISLGPEIVKRFNIKMAIVALPELKWEGLARLINYSLSVFRYNVLIPDYYSISNIWMSVRDFDGILGFATSQRLNMPWNLILKRLMDLGTIIIGGIFAFPFLLVIAILIKLSSPGPALYKHKRLGVNGKEISIFKFRSMVTNADETLKTMLESDPELRKEWEKNYKLKDDPRITKIGRFLRRTSLDEFPQIINVLKGEMSLIGPRPITEEEIEKYGEDYNRIFSVKPGMTGLWQVSGRSDTDYNERVFYDTYYIQSWSLWLDIWILLKTVGAVVHGRGAY
jgi:Undecaprenyl-phosphate galactose phosphotransferase WbaP